MTPHKQLFRHDPGNGVWGDCGRTAIACLLDLAPADVPHFYDNGVRSDVARSSVDAWLAPRGLRLIEIPFPGAVGLDAVLAHQKAVNPGVHYILLGKSRTGVGHVVICRDGEIVHDPSLVDAGIVGPCDEDDCYWITFLGANL